MGWAILGAALVVLSVVLFFSKRSSDRYRAAAFPAGREIELKMRAELAAEIRDIEFTFGFDFPNFVVTLPSGLSESERVRRMSMIRARLTELVRADARFGSKGRAFNAEIGVRFVE